jgi:WD40 repeat protein
MTCAASRYLTRVGRVVLVITLLPCSWAWAREQEEKSSRAISPHRLEDTVSRLFPGIIASSGGAEIASRTEVIGSEVVEGYAVLPAGKDSAEVQVFFPARYGDPFVATSARGQRIVLRPLQGSPVPPNLEAASSGRIEYSGTYPGVDAFYQVAAARTEEFLLLADERAPKRFEYEIVDASRVASAVVHDGAIEFPSDVGPALRIERPYVLDAAGRRSDTAARWQLLRQGVRQHLILRLDDTNLSYPLLVDPSWSTTRRLAVPRDAFTATLLLSGKVLVVGGNTDTLDEGVSTLASAEVYDPATGTWTSTGSLSEARAFHTATLLSSGKVLVVGGVSGVGAVATAEVYDPENGAWTSAGSLAEARRFHTATLLPNGKVLVAGGSICEVYDPARGTWTATGSLREARSSHTATLLPTGRVLVVGGDGGQGSLASAEVYDPESESWTPTGWLEEARSSHTATLLPNGKILVAAGFGLLAGEFLTSAEIYDPLSETWARAGSLNEGRASHVATLLPNGNVLIAAGLSFGFGYQELDSAEIYDSASGTWGSTTRLIEGRVYNSATLLPSGKVLVVGGHSGLSIVSDGVTVATAEIYDPAEGTWASTGSLIQGRSSHTATVLPSGKVLVAGGEVEGEVGGASAEVYDPATGTWASTGSLAHGRSSHTATLLPSGKVLVVGGCCDGGAYLASAEVYDPATGTWASTGSLAQARSSHTATLLLNGTVLVAGGSDDGSAELYDPASGIWVSTGSLVKSRTHHTATLLLDGRVLVAGGRRGIEPEAGTTDSTELYDPRSGKWVLTGSLFQARDSHTATLLPDGKVLVAGGARFIGDGILVLVAAEVYDPISGAWASTESLAHGRADHTATLLPTGKLLVAGGSRDGSAEVYDPAGGIWTATGSLKESPFSHTATLLPTGKVLVVGGGLASAALYDDRLISDSRRPLISGASEAITYGVTLSITGMRFRGDSEADGGTTTSSAVNYPLVQSRSVLNDRVSWLRLDPRSNFSDDPMTLTVSPPSASCPSCGLPLTLDVGWHMLTVVTAGVPSISRLVQVTCSVAVSEPPHDAIGVPIGSSATFQVAAQGAQSYQWQRDPAGTGAWRNIPGATEPSYTTPPVLGADSGSRYRVVVTGICWTATATSSSATLRVADSFPPAAEVLSPSGGEYLLLSQAGSPSNSHLVTWSMSDNIRICRVDVSLLYSNDGGVSYVAAPADRDLPASFGPGGVCGYPGEGTTSLLYKIPTTPPSGISGSLYRIQVVVTDEVGLSTTARSEDPFYIVQPNPEVRTLIFANTIRMKSEAGTTDAEAQALLLKLHELSRHPRVLGFVTDLGGVTDVSQLYAAWDRDRAQRDNANPALANNVLFGCHAPYAVGCPTDRERDGIHDQIRNLMGIYTGVKYVILVGDDRIIPLARLSDRTPLVSESTYTKDSVDLRPDLTTVGQALTKGMYLSDDPLVVLDPVRPDDLSGNVFVPDLAVGRLVETPQEITKTISTFISQDGILDLSAQDPDDHKILVTGYDFLEDSANEIRTQWKRALRVSTDDDASEAPVDGKLVGGVWDDDMMREHLAGNGAPASSFPRYGVMSLNGHATHYAEGTPGADFRVGLGTEDIYGPDNCRPPSPSDGSLDLSGAVVYAVGCHGGLPVPGSCATDGDHSLDLPQTFLARGVVFYVANTGYGWGLKTGVGYSERLVELVTDELTSGPPIVIGDAVKSSKLRYFLSTPRFDAYDGKSLMQWTSFGLPMYTVKTGIDIIAASTSRANRGAEVSRVPSFRGEPRRSGPGPVTRRVGPALVTSEAQVTPLPPFLTQLDLHFDLTAHGLYEKRDSRGNKVDEKKPCVDVGGGGCYYELNGLSSGDSDLPIQPYLIYDSRLSGTSQHGVLWKGGTYEEEGGWVPVRAELQSNGSNVSNHGTLPKTIMIRPITPRTVIGADPPNCRASDLEVSSTVLGAAEAVKANDGDRDYSIERKYRGIDLEVLYFNNTDQTTDNCDRTGPVLGPGPYAGDYHRLGPGTIEWSVPATDRSGVWRVVVVLNDNKLVRDSEPDTPPRGSWAPVELTYDEGSGTWRGSSALESSRVTYVIEAVDKRGNVTWLDFRSADVPSSGVVLQVPRPVEVEAPLPVLAIDDVTVNEPRTGTASTVFTVRLSAPSDEMVHVGYATRDGTATVTGGDYLPNSGTLSFAPGVTVRTISVLVPADGVIESTKDFFVELAGASNATISKRRGEAWILDTDASERLQFSAASYTVSETFRRATIRIRRLGSTSGTATVEYATSDGTAASGVRYTAVWGTLTFAPGVALQAFAVPILDDQAAEGPETVLLSLTSASGKAALGTPSTAVLTIDDDDSLPAFAFGAAEYSVVQGARTTIAVERTGPATAPASVHYATSPGTAVPGTNYTDIAGDLSFAPGVRRRTFTVQALSETADEGDTTALLSLSNPTGGPGLGTPSTAVLHIRDRDVAGTLQFSVASYTVTESGGQATIKVIRSGGAAGGVAVHYATSNGTAVAPRDYTSTVGTLTFDARVIYRTFIVPIANTGPKGDLTVNLTLSSPTGGATLGNRARAVLTIQSGQTELQFERRAYVIGETGTRATITVTRTGPAGPQVTVDYATGDGTAKAAQGDYTPTSGTLTFGPAVRSRIFTVPVSEDAVLEGDETVNLFLRNAQPKAGAFLGVLRSAVLTIRTADPQVEFSKSEFSVSEAASRAFITVVRRPPTKPAVTVEYSTSNGTAVAGTDYLSTSGTLTLASGVTSARFPVKLLHDTAQQGARTVKLNLKNPSNGALLGTQAAAVLSIGDIDVAGKIQFAGADFSVSEIGPLATITVTRTGGTASGVTVDYATSDGSAKQWNNYSPASGRLTFDEGETSKSFTVEILDDGIGDGNKTVTLTLINPRGGGVLGMQSTATLWIIGMQ